MGKKIDFNSEDEQIVNNFKSKVPKTFGDVKQDPALMAKIMGFVLNHKAKLLISLVYVVVCGLSINIYWLILLIKNLM